MKDKAVKDRTLGLSKLARHAGLSKLARLRKLKILTVLFNVGNDESPYITVN